MKYNYTTDFVEEHSKLNGMHGKTRDSNYDGNFFPNKLNKVFLDFRIDTFNSAGHDLECFDRLIFCLMPIPNAVWSSFVKSPIDIKSTRTHIKALWTDLVKTPIKKALGKPLNMVELYGAKKIWDINHIQKCFLDGMSFEVGFNKTINAYARQSFHNKENLSEKRVNDFIENMCYDILEKHHDKMEKNPKFAKQVKETILQTKMELRKDRTYIKYDGKQPLTEEECKQRFDKIEKITGQKIHWDYELKCPYVNNVSLPKQDLDFFMESFGVDHFACISAKEFLKDKEKIETLKNGSFHAKLDCKNRILQDSYEVKCFDKKKYPYANIGYYKDHGATKIEIKRPFEKLINEYDKNSIDGLKDLKHFFTPLNASPVELLFKTTLNREMQLFKTPTITLNATQTAEQAKVQTLRQQQEQKLVQQQEHKKSRGR